MSILTTICDIKMVGESTNTESEIIIPNIVIEENVCEEQPNITTGEQQPQGGVKRNTLLESNRKFISFGYWILKKICSSSDILQPESFEPLLTHLELLSDPTVQNEFVDGFHADYSKFIKKEVNARIKEENNKKEIE